MLLLKEYLGKKLSTRLSFMVVSAMALLLLSSLVVMLIYARRAIKEEALQKAQQTLDNTVECIDNILLSVEQTTGNFYFNILRNVSQPDMMHSYSRHLVESNKFIAGCAIAFKPGFYGDGKNFMAYYHRVDSTIVYSESFDSTPYTEQEWFTGPLEDNKLGWYRPILSYDDNIEPVITFSLPLFDTSRNLIGVLGVDVSLSLLSNIVLSAKPSPNSYCVLLDEDGSYIVHPDKEKLSNQTVYSQFEQEADPSAREVAEAMMSGQAGYNQFRMKGADYYVFFEPFERADLPGRVPEQLKWSVGIIYPENDVFGDYNSLSYYVLAIAFAGLLLLFLLSRKFIRRQLKPLSALTESAHRIANGQYDEVIPESRQSDEIGSLQNNFQAMQQSLANHIGELEEITTTLQERGKVLQEAYNHAQKADRIKTAFLHNMTNQMIDPAESIFSDVKAIERMHETDVPVHVIVDDILQNGKTVAELLNNLIHVSEDERRKEEPNV